MQCERCHNKKAEWQCQKCRKNICTDCAEPTDAGIFCLDCAPGKGGINLVRKAQAESKPLFGEGNEGMKMMFISLLILTVGIGGIFFIGLQSAGSMAALPESFKGTLEAVKSVGTMIVGGLGFLTIMVGLGYFFSCLKK